MSRRPSITVLYEDSQRAGAGGAFPMHDLVMRAVEDAINGETWRLLSQAKPVAKKGVDEVFKDLKRANRIAGAGVLFVLVDSDQIVRHLKKHRAPGVEMLSKGSADAEIAAAICALSDAPQKVRAFLLHPGMEGLVASVSKCDSSLLPDVVEGAKRKRLNDRDILLAEAAKRRHVALRACIREAQPGLAALADAIADRLREVTR